MVKNRADDEDAGSSESGSRMSQEKSDASGDHHGADEEFKASEKAAANGGKAGDGASADQE